MKFPVTERFLGERERWVLHHTCEHCVHYDPPDDRCIHGYRVYDRVAEAERGARREIFYCKEFEQI